MVSNAKGRNIEAARKINATFRKNLYPLSKFNNLPYEHSSIADFGFG